jgi:hypothetical protein
MRAFIKAAALAAVVALSFMPALMPVAALAQAASSSAVVVAAPDTIVSVPWGDWLATLLGDAAAVLSVVILGVVTRFLPATLKAWLTAQRTAQVEQLLERALGFAAQKIAIAVKGKVLDVDVHNQMVEDALQYAIDHGPAKLIAWMGGADAIEQKIIARIPTSPSVQSLPLTPAAAAP